MTSPDFLKANLQERLEWESTLWGPLMAAWAGLLVIRTAVEAFTGPGLVLGSVAGALTLGFQLWFFLRPQTRVTRRWPLHGLWALAALGCWFLGTWAPSTGLLAPRAGAVLEMVLVAGVLAQTGILKGQRAGWLGGIGLLVGSVVLGFVPEVPALRPVLYALGMGVPAVLCLAGEKAHPLS
jgi:hypothetical protein